MNAIRTSLLCAFVTVAWSATHDIHAATVYGVSDGVLWLKARSLGLSDGDEVLAWSNDATGTGTAGNAVQDSGSGNDPRYVANVHNGRPGVAFDNGNGLAGNSGGDSMSVAGFQSSFVDNKQFTIFMITKTNNNTFGVTPTNRQGSVPRMYLRREGFTYQTGTTDVSRVDIAIDSQPNDFEVTTFQHDGTEIEAWLNNISQGTQTTGLGNIGGNGNLYLSWWPANVPQNGTLLELVWFNRALSDIERDSVYTQLNAFYAPEPSTYALTSCALMGLIGACVVRRRKHGPSSNEQRQSIVAIRTLC